MLQDVRPGRGAAAVTPVYRVTVLPRSWIRFTAVTAAGSFMSEAPDSPTAPAAAARARAGSTAHIQPVRPQRRSRNHAPAASSAAEATITAAAGRGFRTFRGSVSSGTGPPETSLFAAWMFRYRSGSLRIRSCWKKGCIMDTAFRAASPASQARV